MLGIDRQSEFGTFVTRRMPQETPVIDQVNSADVFAGGVLPDEFDAERDLSGGVIQEGMLADAAVTTEKLADLAVNNEKLANLAVEAAKLADSSVTATKIANAAVGSAAIAGAAIGTAHIANGAIINAKIGNGAINNAKIENGAINNAKIQNGAINNAKIQNGAINNAKIANATIEMAKIKSVNADTITAGTLTGRTVKASGGIQDVWLQNNGIISWRRNGSEKCYIYATGSGSMLQEADSNYLVQTHDYFLNANGDIILAGDDIHINYDDDNNGKDCYFKSHSATLVTAKITTTGKIQAHSTIEQNAIDFAEYFENLKRGIIKGGETVVMERGRVRKAKKGEIPFGVVTLTPAFVGNIGAEDAGDSWHGKYLRDEDMQYVMEGVDFVTYLVKSDKYAKKPNKKIHLFADQKPPKGAVEIARRREKRRVINPDYDEKRKFIPREDRPEEWSLIGLLGQCLIKKGQPVAPQWIKMKEFNHKYDFYLVR